MLRGHSFTRHGHWLRGRAAGSLTPERDIVACYSYCAMLLFCGTRHLFFFSIRIRICIGTVDGALLLPSPLTFLDILWKDGILGTVL